LHFMLYFWCHKVSNSVIKGDEMSEKPITIQNEADVRPQAAKPMFGRADHRLDPKKRLTIPTNWFERMGRPEEVYVMPSLTQRNCIEVFSPSEFDRRTDAMRDASLTNPALSTFLSNLGELIECVSVDSQNRIRIKDSLLAFAELTEQVVFIGAGFHIELWALENRPAIDGSESQVIGEILAQPKFLKKVGLRKDDDDDA
jgi:MraZ protein